MLTAIWFGWAFLCAWVVRIAVVALLPRRFGAWSYLLAYAWWPSLFVAGAFIVESMGFDMYGGDPESATRTIGRAIFLYSPLGLPVVFGVPPVIVLDVGVLLWRNWIRPTGHSD
jgi:hypothetical protein